MIHIIREGESKTEIGNNWILRNVVINHYGMIRALLNVKHCCSTIVRYTSSDVCSSLTNNLAIFMTRHNVLQKGCILQTHSSIRFNITNSFARHLAKRVYYYCSYNDY